VSDAIQTVKALVDHINTGPEDFTEALDRWFTSQTVWENVGCRRPGLPRRSV
jgi:limonene-1,2-epoxide hydrolase